MSCDYFVHCVQCQTRLDLTMPSYEQAQAHALVRHREAIAALRSFYLDASEPVQLGDRYLDVFWFAEHAGHELVVVDEYGRVDGRCGERYTCDRCASSHYCNQPKGHEGEHSGRF